MQNNAGELELRERLGLIENMIAEGRRTTERWGWAFVLWGVVYYAAIGWSAWIHNGWPWLVCVAGGVIASAMIVSLKRSHHPATMLGRAIGSIWISVAISMALLFTTLGISGRLADQHVFVAVIAAMLGMANGASGLILRWKAQLACAVVWWAAAVVACFGSEEQSAIIFLAAIFLCQIVFGIFTMIADARKQRGLGHA